MATILIVDDKPLNRQLLATLLGYRGHRLREAEDGAEALERARAEPPDLIITDLLMPTMDGYELVRQVRSDPALATTPVILYTAKYHKSELHNLMQAGGVQYLDKPSEPEAILRAVEQALAAPPSPAPPLPQEFDREHLRLVTDKLARTIDQMELNQLRMTALADLGRQLAEERDPRAVLEQGCHGARRLIAAKYAFVLMLAEDRQSILHFCTSGLDKGGVARLDAPAADLHPLWWLLDDDRPHHRRDGRAQLDALGLLPDDPGPRSLLIVPKDRLAALILVEKLGAEEFGGEDEWLAATLTAQMILNYKNKILIKIVNDILKN